MKLEIKIIFWKKVQVMVRLLLPAILVHEEVKLFKIFIFYSTDEFLYK